MHSVEEYIGKLWEVFPPAEYFTGLISSNLETGFLIINISLFVFGLYCWLIPVRMNYTSAKFIIWFWIIIEFINGIGHPIWSLVQKSYTPGTITALILLFLSIYLYRHLQYKSKNQYPKL